MSSNRRILPLKNRHMQADTSLAIVNIVLLMLFFFLATGSLMNSPSFGVDLSETADLPIDQLPRPVLIIGPDGALRLDDVPVASDLLATAVQDLTLLHVLIAREAPAQELLDLLARPGLDHLDIRLVTIHRQPAT